MKRIDLNRYAPLGRETSQLLMGSYLALTVAVIRTMWFFSNFFEGIDRLYEGIYSNRAPRVLIPGATIAPFSRIIDGCFSLFPCFWLLLVMEIVACYAFHSKDTMSIYLMRRLPDSRELHRRCWGKPLILFLRSIALMAALTVFYFGIYLLFTPKGCLPY